MHSQFCSACCLDLQKAIILIIFSFQNMWSCMFGILYTKHLLTIYIILWVLHFHTFLTIFQTSHCGPLIWVSRHAPTCQVSLTACSTSNMHTSTNDHLSVILLTLFFWQVSQRDHVLHSDKTQSTGWTTTRSPADRASRTLGSSLLAAVMITLLWHVDESHIKKTDIWTQRFLGFSKASLGLVADRTTDRSQLEKWQSWFSTESNAKSASVVIIRYWVTSDSKAIS